MCAVVCATRVQSTKIRKKMENSKGEEKSERGKVRRLRSISLIDRNNRNNRSASIDGDNVSYGVHGVLKVIRVPEAGYLVSIKKNTP